jgi:hypothetical protein
MEEPWKTNGKLKIEHKKSCEVSQLSFSEDRKHNFEF